MNLKIFYSWQSQTKSEVYNRHFIKECILISIQKLKGIPDTADIEYQLVDSTMGEPGSPPVADQILKKIIPNCDILIADMSVVNKLNFFQNLIKSKTYRPVANSNVLIEFSTAMAELKHERVIHVMNEAYGEPQGLPFDIKHLKYPVGYFLNSSKKIEEVRDTLVKALTEKIRLTSIYCIQHYRERFSPMKVWDSWELIIPQKSAYVSNDKIETLANTIYDSIETPGTIIRVLGLSGLGKTRILFELFRPKEDFLSQKRSGRVLYYDCNDGEGNSIKMTIEKVIEDDNEYVVILDNCSDNLCRLLIPLARRRGSKISIITMNNNPEEISRKIDEVKYLLLDKKDLTDVVEHILKTDFSELDEDSIRKIKEFSQGIPMMAVLLGESVRNGEKFVGRLEDKYLLDRLLGEFADEQEVRTLLKSSSLFLNFGHTGELINQFDFIATNRDLTITNDNDEVSKQTFRKTINHYLDRQIFEEKGRLVGLRPFPLAIYLAKEWLDTADANKIIRLLTAIGDLEQPHQKNLSEAFAEQMRHLGYDDKAKSIVEKITGVGSPFGNAKVLNTELGSRLFRAFVEVNPEAIAENFDRIFSDLSDTDIEKIVGGRRNLIIVLEKLCFNKQTFLQGAKLLFRFAVAENESWANNASGQFIHLFNIMLAGTEAKPIDKIKIIEWGLDKQDVKYKTLAVRAMGSALNFGSFLRMSGAEIQGSHTLEDYRPYEHEVKEYWEIILDKLILIMKEDPDCATLARDMVLPKLRGIIRAGFPEIVASRVEQLISNSLDEIDDVLKQLKLVLRYDADYVTDELKFFFERLITENTKDDFQSSYQRLIVNHQFDYTTENFEERINEQILALAASFFKAKIDWSVSIPMFFNQGQYGSYLFGQGLAKGLKDSKMISEFMSIAAENIALRDRDHVNLATLGGIASELGENHAEEMASFFIENEHLHYILFYLTSLREHPFSKTDKLFSMVDNGTATISDFQHFANNGRLNPDLKALEEFIFRLFNYADEGHIVAFKIVVGLVYWNPDLNETMLPWLRKAILHLKVFPRRTNLDEYQWWETVKRILNNYNDEEFAFEVNKNIINSIDWNNSYHLNHYVQDIYEILMKSYFRVVWADIGDALIAKDENYIKFYGLKNILGSTIGGIGRSVGVLFEGDIDTIFTWANNYATIAPTRLAELVPIFATKIGQENAHWHPISKRLIDTFGERDEVLNNLDANMGTFSWTGSTVPYYQAQLELMKGLLDHPKSEVEAWAKRKTGYLKLQIIDEKNRDAEWGIN